MTPPRKPPAHYNPEPMFGLITQQEAIARAAARVHATRMIELGGVFLDTIPKGTSGTGPFWDGLEPRKTWERRKVRELRAAFGPDFTSIETSVQMVPLREGDYIVYANGYRP